MYRAEHLFVTTFTFIMLFEPHTQSLAGKESWYKGLFITVFTEAEVAALKDDF